MPSTPPDKVNKMSSKMQMVKVALFFGVFFFCSAIVVHECFRSPHPLHESPGYFVSFYFFRHDLHSTCSKRRPPDCLFSFALKVSTVITMATVEGSGLLSIITVFLWMCKLVVNYQKGKFWRWDVRVATEIFHSKIWKYLVKSPDHLTWRNGTRRTKLHVCEGRTKNRQV